MATTAKKGGVGGAFLYVAIFLGSVVSIWSAAAFLSGLAQANWQLSELLRQYLVAIGVMQEFHTFVDFYTHIKGVEYIICALFLGAFPVMYKYMNRSSRGIETV